MRASIQANSNWQEKHQAPKSYGKIDCVYAFIPLLDSNVGRSSICTTTCKGWPILNSDNSDTATWHTVAILLRDTPLVEIYSMPSHPYARPW